MLVKTGATEWISGWPTVGAKWTKIKYVDILRFMYVGHDLLPLYLLERLCRLPDTPCTFHMSRRQTAVVRARGVTRVGVIELKLLYCCVGKI